MAAALVRVTFTFTANYYVDGLADLERQVRESKRAMHIEEATTRHEVLSGDLEDEPCGSS